MNEHTVSLYKIGADGALQAVGTPSPAGDNPFSVSIASDYQ